MQENAKIWRKPLVVLAEQFNWSSLEETFGELYVPHCGRPGLPTRLMVSDESAVAMFLENPYWQYWATYTT